MASRRSTQRPLANRLWVDRREANLIDGGAPFYRSYPCADGQHVAVGAIEPVQFEALCAGLGVGSFAQFDRAAWPGMAECFAERFAARTRDEWVRSFAQGEACVTPVLSLAEAARNPHALARRPVAAGPEGAATAPQFVPRAGVAPPARPVSVDEVLARWSR